MKTGIILFAFLVFPLALFNLLPAGEGSGTPTPPVEATSTLDVFAEPPLPEHPTQLELGRHVYWHHCMPCHGDAGQGLTDDFRQQWEPDHQNCWDPGCHSGRYDYDSFPVPTYVPSLVGLGLTTRYDPATLLAFLESTHPPQDPGLLAEEEYQALVAYLHQMNGAAIPVQISSMTPTPSATPMNVTPSSMPAVDERKGFPLISASNLFLLLGILFLGIALVLFVSRKKP